MGDSPNSVSPKDLIPRIGARDCPILIDVRRADVYAQAPDILPTAKWRDHLSAGTWSASLSRDREVIVYCVHGHNVSHGAATVLRVAGHRVRVLEGGIEGYRAAGGLMLRKDAVPHRSEDAPGRWITRERPKIDRVACPWFIRRFIDPDAEIHFVATQWVNEVAAELNAIPFDIPEVTFSHEGKNSSFDAFLAQTGIADSALLHLAAIVRGADTGDLEDAPQAAGLLAISRGLSAVWKDDQTLMEQSFAIYDALLAWCRHDTA